MVNISELEAAVKSLPGDPDVKAVLGGLATTLVNVDVTRRALLVKERQAVEAWLEQLQKSWSPMELEASGIATTIRNAGFAALGTSKPVDAPTTQDSTFIVEVNGVATPVVPAEVSAYYERSFNALTSL